MGIAIVIPMGIAIRLTIRAVIATNPRIKISAIILPDIPSNTGDRFEYA
jgi:hypothetical protein